jgi:UDP-N-acetylmuramoyl-L-alanyl-D-glutamate--2,6-diaminopimelate ligase
MNQILNLIKKYFPKKLFLKLQPPYHYLLSWLGAVLFRFPSQHLIVIGVTGTTGKTTSVFLIAKTLEAAGYKVGYTTTAMFNNGKNEWLNDKKMTMIGRFFTPRILRQMVNNKCQYAIIETSSEGVRQYRHRFINYDILVFTGLYPEHLESHGGFENYKLAKGELFSHLRRGKTKYVDDNKIVHKPQSGLKKLNFSRIKKTIVVNYDDDHSDFFLSFWAEQKIGYYDLSGTKKEKDILEDVDLGEKNKNLELIEYGDVVSGSAGTGFHVSLLTDFFVSEKSEMKDININLKLLGAFNATNSMNALSVGLSQGMGLEEIKRGLENVKGVTGRLEMISEGQSFTVIVDYAFEPQAVSRLYDTVRLIPHEKIIHILGSAGGGRDRDRRGVLGQLAGKNADYVIVTNEDPYDEDPRVIVEEVALGAENTGKVNNRDLFKILDRREAIKKALSLAEKNDIVLITGKGSEQAICIAGGAMIPWDDRKVAREELLKL